jgi:hypothetical protein
MIFLDGDSFLAVKMNVKMNMQGSEVVADAFMSNYKEVDETVMPFYIENQMNGEVMSTITVESVEFDAEIANTLFEKPVSK